MSHPSLEELLELRGGPERANLARDSIQRIITFGLPSDARHQFFPGAHLESGEWEISEKSHEFVEAGAVHLLLQRLAQDPQVPSDVRPRINLRKAELFFAACVQREPPAPPDVDPVVAYGWDRVHDKAIIQRMQDQCAEVFLACDRRAFVLATPAMAQYCDHDPAKWYHDLAAHVTSPYYQDGFEIEIMKGVKILRDFLSTLTTKLAILLEAMPAGDRETVKQPHEVVSELCVNVGFPALKHLHLPDDAADEIRHLFESIQKSANQPDHVDFQITLYRMEDVMFHTNIISYFNGSMSLSAGLGLIAQLTMEILPGLKNIPFIRNIGVEGEIANRVIVVCSTYGTPYGLWH